MRNSNGKMEVAATTLSLEQAEVQLTASSVVEHSLTSLALPHGVDFAQSRQQWFIMLTFFLAQMKVVALETRF
jgi:hypothetical protein